MHLFMIHGAHIVPNATLHVAGVQFYVVRFTADLSALGAGGKSLMIGT
jgi:hypothetical protein